ncbi:MAG: transposase [Deltaproteobacteria bacterium]|nr:transposase [Deltaproteobacteria bacterium]
MITLAQVIPWQAIAEMVIPDLKKTTKKGCLHLGRRLTLRIHLGAFLLQMLYDMTDRETEYDIEDNAAARIFCGYGSVDRWNCPDHTKIEEFRNRLDSETKRQIANSFAALAVDLGFADPRDVDIDSTVQEANISYPSDSVLMKKLAKKSYNILEWLKKEGSESFQNVKIDLKNIISKAKEYYFTAKNTVIEKKREIFRDLHKEVKKQIYPVLELLEKLDSKTLQKMPWNIRKITDQIVSNGKRYLLDVAHFIRYHTMKPGKILSWHAQEVCCIKKGKVGKEVEFGRVYQLARIGGNLLFVGKCTSIRMEDAASVLPMIQEHSGLFKDVKIDSMCTDKSYFSYANMAHITDIKNACLGFQMEDMEDELFAALRDRRSGLEALIGHAKHGGQLGKSRMKSDETTLGAGYTAIGGFNLRQIIRHQKGKIRNSA